MKRYSHTTHAAAQAAAIVLALGTPLALRANENTRSTTAAAATGASSAADPSASARAMRIHPAAENAEEARGAEHFTGQEIHGADNAKLGEVADVILDCQQGKIAFYVASSGGWAGVDDTLRILPATAISHRAGADAFTTELTAAQWQKLPVLNEQDFEAGRINLTSDQQQQLTAAGYRDEHFGADYGPRLARAAKIRGKSVRSNGQEIGQIEDVLLDLEQGNATALVDPEDDFAGSDRDFVVPLGRLQMSGEDAVTTTLSRADFHRGSENQVGRTDSRDRADRSVAQDEGSSHRSRATVDAKDEALAPTGRTDNAASVPPALQSAARSIRQIWDTNPELAKLDLTVTPENGRLVFRGTVPNADVWEKAKDTAEGVVRGIDITNHISIADDSR